MLFFHLFLTVAHLLSLNILMRFMSLSSFENHCILFLLSFYKAYQLFGYFLAICCHCFVMCFRTGHPCTLPLFTLMLQSHKSGWETQHDQNDLQWNIYNHLAVLLTLKGSLWRRGTGVQQLAVNCCLQRNFGAPRRRGNAIKLSQSPVSLLLVYDWIGSSWQSREIFFQ